ncbi:DUF1000-domain-containing protein [Thelephora ganbajun]|uniref:DUF1000-domain-containing protein n=1 Tax=Thelephora ganbajun TaxID=370292 RepID=A0ACB6ZUB4_THEGA|nr:DUF1000-domain-containing protein [Thelephora ganbajun]
MPPNADQSLLGYVDHSQCNCLNESAGHTLKSIMQSHKEPGSYLLSDVDEQLLLNVSFHQMVRIKALRVHSHKSSQGPLIVNILVNRPSIGFEDVQDAQESEIAQMVRLSEEDVRVGKQIPLRFVRFQSVNSVHLFIKSNQGGSDETRIDELDFFGSLAQSVLDRKIKFISQIAYLISRKNTGTGDPPGLNAIPSALNSELLDVAVGLACSSMVILHRETLLLFSKTTFEVAMITAPLMVVDWLNNWPIGLKLNRELSKFCSQTFLVLISSWNYWLPSILEVALYGFAYLGLLGALTLVAFTADVTQVATLHLHMCHVIVTTAVHGLRLSTSTLWNLFQGIVILCTG